MAFQTYLWPNERRQCEGSTDCTAFTSSCSLGAQHCSGAVYVNTDTDLDELQALDDAIQECASESQNEWECAPCDEPAPAAVCNGDGFCVPEGI
jgi:hypothetical protein